MIKSIFYIQNKKKYIINSLISSKSLDLMNIGNNMKTGKFQSNSIFNEIGNYSSGHGNSLNSQFKNFPSFQSNESQNFGMPHLNIGMQNKINEYERIAYSGLPLAERQDLNPEGTQIFPPDEDQNQELPTMMDMDQFDQLDDILDEQSSDQSIPQQKQPKPQVERDVYDQQNQLCKQNNTKLDLWLDEQQTFIPEQYKQKDPIKVQIKVDKLFNKYLIHLTKKQRQQLYTIVQGAQNSKLSGLIESESQIQIIAEKQQKQNKYVIHRNFKYPKIQVLPSEIGLRKYLVYIGAEAITITACVLTINIVQLKALIQKSSISLISVIKSLLALQNKKFKFKRTNGNHAQHLLQTITQVAINKSSLLLSNQGKNNKKIQSYFIYDFLIFNNCTLFEVNTAQRTKKQIDKLKEQKKEDQEQFKYKFIKKQKFLTKQQKQQLTFKTNKLIRFIKLIKTVLQFRKLVINGSLLKIQQQLMAHSKTEICIILVSILKTHVKYLESVNNSSQQAFKLEGILRNIKIPQIKLDQIHNILLKSVNFSDLYTKYTEYIQTLNKFTISSSKQCLQVILILLKNMQAKSGFVHRFTGSATLPLKQKQEQSLPILLKTRNIMLYFYTQSQNLTPTLLQNLHEYFSAIGDQQTALKIQQTLLIKAKPTINYILILFSFFLQKKINTINYQFFLYNKYIKLLQQYNIQKQIVEINGNIDKIQLLNKLKDMCLNIMYEIRQAVYKRQFQNLKMSKIEIQFRNLGNLLRQRFGNQWNQREYKDVLLILDHIYNKNYLKLNKKVQSQLTSKVFRAEQSQYVQKPISTSYLRIPLLKNYFYHIVYNSELNKSAQLKRFLQILPPLYRYHSIYFAALCQISGFLQNYESILKSNYLKLLNESESSYSCDLVIIMQLLLKNHTQVYEHNKFKLQLNIRSLIKYLKNVDSIYQADNQQETICLLRSVCQLCYSIARDNIFQLQKMRQKLCQLLVQRFKPILNQNKMIIAPKPEKKKRKNKQQTNKQNKNGQQSKVQSNKNGQQSKVQQNKIDQNIIQQNKNKQNRIILSKQLKQKEQSIGLSQANLKLKEKKNIFKFQQHATTIQYHIPQDKKQVFLHSNLLQLILKLSTSQKTRKKQCIDTLKILLTKYPQKFSLYYYFLRIKYGIKLGQKKQVRDIMFDNLLNIIKAKNIKAFTNFVESQIFMNQLMDILYGELKEKSLDFITDMAQYVVDVGRSIHSNLISQHIFKFYEHFLNENQTPQEQSYCCYRKITEILLERLQINFDASELPNRVINLSVIRKNLFLSYPLFQAINFKKVCLPDHRKDGYVLKLINDGLSVYNHSRESQVLKKCRAKLYQYTRQYLRNKQTYEYDKNEKNKIQRKIRILYKKQYFNNGQHGNWVSQMVEILSRLQTQKVQNFRQIFQQHKSQKIKNQIKQHIFKQEKSQKYIRKIFAKMRIKIKKIANNCFVENQKKQSKN